MKLFAFVWTLLFLLAVIPVMRLDHRLHLRRLWGEIRQATKRLSDAFVYLGVASKFAGNSISNYAEAFSEPEVGQLYYCDDMNETFVWDGRMWEKVTNY